MIFVFFSAVAEMAGGRTDVGFLPSRTHRAGGIPRPLDGAQTQTTNSNCQRCSEKHMCQEYSFREEQLACERLPVCWVVFENALLPAVFVCVCVFLCLLARAHAHACTYLCSAVQISGDTFQGQLH